MKVPALDTSVFIIPGERVKNGDERLVVLNRAAKSVVESQRGKHPNPCVRAGTEGRRTETGGEDEQHRPEVGPRTCGAETSGRRSVESRHRTDSEDRQDGFGGEFRR